MKLVACRSWACPQRGKSFLAAQTRLLGPLTIALGIGSPVERMRKAAQAQHLLPVSLTQGMYLPPCKG